MATAQCNRCIFQLSGTLACVAFPHGIPAEIADGRFDHAKPYKGDGGIRFVPWVHLRQAGDPLDMSHLEFADG